MNLRAHRDQIVLEHRVILWQANSICNPLCYSLPLHQVCNAVSTKHPLDAKDPVAGTCSDPKRACLHEALQMSLQFPFGYSVPLVGTIYIRLHALQILSPNGGIPKVSGCL